MPCAELCLRNIANKFLISELAGLLPELGPRGIKRLSAAVELNEKGAPHLTQFVAGAAAEGVRLLHCEPAFHPGKCIARFAPRLEHRADGLAIGLRKPRLLGQLDILRDVPLLRVDRKSTRLN